MLLPKRILLFAVTLVEVSVVTCRSEDDLPSSQSKINEHDGSIVHINSTNMTGSIQSMGTKIRKPKSMSGLNDGMNNMPMIPGGNSIIGILPSRDDTVKNKLIDIIGGIPKWPKCDRNFWIGTKHCGFGSGFSKSLQIEWLESVKKCILYDGTQQSWFDAAKTCKKYGAHTVLATLTDMKNLKMMTDVFKIDHDSYWVGYDDLSWPGCWSSVRTPARTIECIPDNWPQWSGPPSKANHCGISGSSVNWTLAGNNCDIKQYFICDEKPDDLRPQGGTAMIVSGLPKKLVLGDMVSFNITYVTLMDVKMKIKIGTHEDELVLFEIISHVGVDTPIKRKERKLLPRESITEEPWTFDHYEKNRRCEAKKMFHFELMAREEYEELHTYVFFNGDDTMHREHHFDIEIHTGHYFATLMKPKEKRLVNGGNYTFKCLARLGKDSASSGNLVISNIKRPDNSEYRYDGVKSWSLEYSAHECKKIGGKGVKPKNFELTEVKCGSEIAMSGYHVNFTFHIHGNIAGFHLRQIGCYGNTDFKKQSKNMPPEEKWDGTTIDVIFLPRTPKLVVLSKDPDGVIVAGGTIRFECTAFIGTVYPQKIIWHVYSGGKTTPRETWEVNYPLANSMHKHGITFSGKPGAKGCIDADIIFGDTGACARKVDDLLTWDDAELYCERKFNFNLLKIQTAVEFQMVQEKIGGGEYWIGMNKLSGQYKWWDDVEANPEKWGRWSANSTSVNETGRTDCVTLTTGGLRKVNCRKNMRFICQSPAFSLPTPRNFDPDYGPKWTSIVVIEVNDHDGLQGIQLQCSTQRDSTVDAMMKTENINELSTITAPFRLVYEPLKPTLEVVEKLVASEVFIYLTCSAVVAKNGAMSWVIIHSNNFTRKWVVTSAGVAVLQNAHGRVTIRGTKDTFDKNSGRSMQSVMTINLSPKFHRVNISCFSFDVGIPLVLETSPREGDLRASEFVDLRYMRQISYRQLEGVFGKGFLKVKDRRFRKTQTKYIILTILVLMIIGVCLLLYDKSQGSQKLQRLSSLIAIFNEEHPPEDQSQQVVDSSNL